MHRRDVLRIGMAVIAGATLGSESSAATPVKPGSRATGSVEQWGMFETSLPGPSEGNPYQEVTLSLRRQRSVRRVTPLPGSLDLRPHHRRPLGVPLRTHHRDLVRRPICHSRRRQVPRLLRSLPRPACPLRRRRDQQLGSLDQRQRQDALPLLRQARQLLPCNRGRGRQTPEPPRPTRCELVLERPIEIRRLALCSRG
jgi:hypothetical protein